MLESSRRRNCHDRRVDGPPVSNLPDVHSLIEALRGATPDSPGTRNTQACRPWIRVPLGRLGYDCCWCGLDSRRRTQIVVRNEIWRRHRRSRHGMGQLKLGLEYGVITTRTNRRQFNQDIHRYEELREMGWLIIQ